MEEIWKDIVGFEGIYQVSNLGKVKRLGCEVKMENQVTSWKQSLPEYVFKPSCDSRGYAQVVLTIGEDKRTARIHRLVAEAFLEPPSQELVQECINAGVDKVFVNHIDSDITNNSVGNLEWCSPAHNLKHSYQFGNKIAKKGEDHANSMLKESEVLEIYRLASTKVMSQEKIGEMFGIKQITVSNILCGRSWSWLTGAKKISGTRKKRTKKISEKVPKETH